MNNNWQHRTALILGNKDKIEKLRQSHVLIAGLGGVGAYAAEHLCRTGIGRITIVDGDKVYESNKNRQLLALEHTVGEDKVDVMKRRMMDINPELDLTVKKSFIEEERISELIFGELDYVVDAIDTLSPKVSLITHCVKKNYRVVSSMGAGGVFDPEKIHIADLSKSYNCRLAFYLRKQLRKKGIEKGVKVVFSSEKVSKQVVMNVENEKNQASMVGTISYIPAIFGGFCASVVIRDIIH